MAGVCGFRIVPADRGCRCWEGAPKAQRQQQRFELGEHGVGSAGFSLVAREAYCCPSDQKKSRPLSPPLLDALKAPQPSLQEWIRGGPFEVRLERFSENSQEAKWALLLNENHSRVADDQAGASTMQTLLEGKRSRFPRLLLSSRLLARSGHRIGVDVSAGPPTGYITHLSRTYPKKGFRRAHSPGTTRACEENLMLRNLP